MIDDESIYEMKQTVEENGLSSLTNDDNYNSDYDHHYHYYCHKDNNNNDGDNNNR